MGEIRRSCHRLSKMFMRALYPEHIKCLGCGKDLAELNVYDLCDKCINFLEFNNGRTCVKCGKNVIGQANYCSNCESAVRHFDYAYAPLLYTGLTSRLIKRLKYHNAPYLATTFARYLASAYVEGDYDVDIVVPVPMHADKKRRRGYNQAELLAKEFCKLTDLPIDTEHLIKLIDTDTQTHKTREEREALGNIYKLTDVNAFVGKCVLIIDDIITTGSTLDMCAEILGANKVYALAVAHSKLEIRQSAPLNNDPKLVELTVD